MRAGSALGIVVSGIIAFAAGSGLAQTTPSADLIGAVQIQGTRVAELDLAHVKIAVDLTVVPAQTVTLRNLHLSALHLNGLAVFAEPLNQEVALRKGVLTALPALYVTVWFRDLYSVEPLRQMIEKQNVHVSGELIAGLRLSFMEKLALHTQHPGVAIALSQDVPAEVGGALLERNVALAMLSVVDVGLAGKAKAGKYLPGMRPTWIRDLEAQAEANLFEVESSYTLKQGGADYPVTLEMLGFRIDSGVVVTTAEAKEPWKYDPEFLGAVKAGTAKLEKNSQEIRLLPMGRPGADSARRAQDFSVEMRGIPEEESVTAAVSGHRQVKVLRRASPTALAVLVQHAPSSPKGLAVASAAVASKDSWEAVAVCRLRVDSTTGQRSVEVVQLGARRNGRAIQLTEPVDLSALGSPITTPEGVIGLVQDEQAGAFLPADLLPRPGEGR